MMKTWLLAALLGRIAFAQGPPPAPNMNLDAPMPVHVIHGTLKGFNEGYVYPEVAAQMARAIRERQKRGEYDSVTSAQKFAETLTEHLRDVSHDKHLRLDYRSQVLPPQPAGPPPPDEMQKMMEQQRAALARSNFGFQKVERLAGNIGYLDLRGFAPV